MAALMRRPSLRRVDWIALARALAIGAVGGAVFDHLQLPLAWLLGAMVFVTIAATSGVRVTIPKWMNSVSFSVLGLLMGAGFSPALFADIATWWLTASVMLIYVVLVSAAGALFFYHVLHYDRATAYFAALPGGIAEMTAFGIAYGADARTVTLLHSSRILLVTLAVPLGLRFIAGFEPQGVRSLGGGLFAIAPSDALLLVAIAVLGFFLARAIRLPAPAMIGALVLSGLCHATGLSEARPPGAVIALAQLSIGVAIGCQFVGANPRVIVRTIAIGCATIGATLALAVGIAVALALGGDHRLDALILAFAPAGITEMSVVAHALGLDIVFVVSHHMIRIVFLVLLAPLGLRLMPGPAGADRLSC